MAVNFSAFGTNDLALTPLQMNRHSGAPQIGGGSVAQPPITAPVVSQTPVGAPPVATPPPLPHPTTPPATTPPPAAPPPVTQQSATSALDNFANSAGMKFAIQQAMNALNNQYAARGMVQSGAAMKGIGSYIDNMALQDYFMPYMNELSGQQGVGAGAASSIAGVGSSFGNTAAGINSGLGNAITGINGSMGGAIQNGANGNANAAIIQALAGNTLGNGIASGLGSLASSFMPGGKF